ncbi:uncharacterized protein LOC110467163 [Mizuhopecten yessoensis]|uniref:uncharacterized protein LOC110467163 n=1 Tax=Mizuhopecten yessoensis TaxID=6573 RepID=UPI000B45AFBD|nr:uncharacterized protein LOC110467163 [Mizuhopecten yessoensis]
MTTSNFLYSWCALDKFKSYEDYREHDNMHFDLDFMNGVQREYGCSFCHWGHFIEYDVYCRHEKSHYDIRDTSSSGQPPPKRKRFFLGPTVNSCQSPVPGHYHVQSPRQQSPVPARSQIQSPVPSKFKIWLKISIMRSLAARKL